jgi:hypothetical protein
MHNAAFNATEHRRIAVDGGNNNRERLGRDHLKL